MLCLSAPSWKAIAQCEAPVRQLFRDLARGRPFPTCPMSDGGAQARNDWSRAPRFCPPQYMRPVELENGTSYSCDYSGAISVIVGGELFSRTWWSLTGDSVTEFASTAKSMLGNWDTRYDDDYTRWLSTQPMPSAAPADRSIGS